MGKASILLPPSIVKKNVLGLNLRLFLAALTGVMMGPLSRVPNAQKGTSREEPSNREVRQKLENRRWASMEATRWKQRYFGPHASPSPFYADLRERQYRGSRRRPAHQKCGMKRCENQQVLQLRQHRLSINRLRQDAVIFDPAIRIHIGFNHYRVISHIAERRFKRRLFELGTGIKHQRDVSAAGLQFGGQSKEAEQQSKKQYGGDNSRRSRDHESMERVLQAHQKTFKPWTARARSLARNRDPQFQRQIRRSFLPS